MERVRSGATPTAPLRESSCGRIPAVRHCQDRGVQRFVDTKQTRSTIALCDSLLAAWDLRRCGVPCASGWYSREATFNLAIARLNLRCAVRRVPHLRSKIYMRRHENWLFGGYFFLLHFWCDECMLREKRGHLNEARAHFSSWRQGSSPLLAAIFFAPVDSIEQSLQLSGRALRSNPHTGM